MLSIKNLEAGYGKVKVLHGISMEVPKAKVVTLIGSNGDVQADLGRAMDLFPRLKERREQLAGTLSGGEQQMLAMARAVMLNPEVILLDEPSMGLAPILVG